MYDMKLIEDNESALLAALRDVKTDNSARAVILDHLPFISKLTLANWEREKLGIMALDIPGLSEAKIQAFRKMASRVEMVEDEEHERAREKLSRTYCVINGKGYSYMIIEGKNLRPIPSQEMVPLVRLLAGEDKLEESRIYESIHCKRVIDKITTHISPSGKTHYTMVKLESGKYESICHIAIEEMITNQMKQLAGYKVDPKFEKMVREHYQYIFHIYEYALALKFAFDKTNVIWLREHSDTGKTFFLGAREAKDYIFITNETIRENDFVGDGPEKWGKMLFFFIDEAQKFSSEMKNACLPYRMNYGGRVELDMPLRILSSDNEITDLTNGVDKQINNRVINIHYKGKIKLRNWLDDNKLDATTAQIMWQKIIFEHILNLLKDWEQAENLQSAASEKIREFKARYKTGDMMDLGDYAKELVTSVILECSNPHGDLTMPITNDRRDFRDFLIKENKSIYIKSPKAFFALLFDEYAPEKKKAFFKRYPNNEAIAALYGDEYSKAKRINERVIKAMLVTFVTSENLNRLQP